MKKSILSLVLILCMITTLLPVNVKATDNILTVGSGKQYSTVQAAYLAAHDGDTIQINESIIEEVTLDITPDKTVTIEGISTSIFILGRTSAALTLKGEGTIILKNIFLLGPSVYTLRSYGLYVNEESKIVVQNEGNVSARGGTAIGINSLLSSSGVHNVGPSTINIDYAVGGVANDSYGVVNEGSGTVNVKSAHSSSAYYSVGVANQSNGTVNVTTAGCQNTIVDATRACCLWNTGTGTINAKSAESKNYPNATSVVNENGGRVNIQEYDSTLQGANINTNVLELNLMKGSSASCFLDSIIVSNIGPTQIGNLPQTYMPTIKGSYGSWFADQAKTIPAPAVIMQGTTVLYGTYYNYIPYSPTVPLLSLIQSDRVSLSASYTTGSNAITTKGFEWKKSSDNTYNLLSSTTPEFTAELIGLESNTHYEIRSFVQDSITHYSESVDVLTLPSSPTLISFTSLNQSALLRWTNEGTSNYQIYQKEPGDSNYQLVTTVSDCECAVNNLQNGKPYQFLVKAVNASGESAASNAGSVTPMKVAQAPSNLVATAGNAQATLSFTAPADHGGSPITGYVVTANPGGVVAVGLNSPITITGLTNGTTYTFTVKATNAVGDSTASESSNSVIPIASQKPVATPTVAPGAATPPTASPVTVQATTDKKGNASATVTNARLNQAITLGQKASDKRTVQLNIASKSSAKSVTLKFKKASLKKLLNSNPKSFTLDTILTDISMNKAAVSSIINQSGDPVSFTIRKVATVSLSKVQKKTVKQMPVYAVSIRSKKKNLTSLGKGNMTISIPYKLKKGQTAQNITVYTLSSKGKRKAVSSCSYNSKTKTIRFQTSQVTTFCIGAK